MAKENRRKQRAKRTNQPDLSKNALWAAAIFAALGAALAFYATNLTFSIESQGLVEASGCSLNDWINCDIANASSYAKMFGIPVAWWGFLFYAFSGFFHVRESLPSVFTWGVVHRLHRHVCGQFWNGHLARSGSWI